MPKAIPGVAKLQRYMSNASQPMPARYDNYNLVERLGAEQIFHPEFLQQVNQESPRFEMAEVYRSAEARSLINQMLAFDFRYTLADNDLPKVTRACELAGVEARFPMLHDSVVSFSAKLAPDLKLKRTQLRYFFKKALNDFLPKEVIEKHKHGFGLPFGQWLQSHDPLKQIAMDSLSNLKRRDIVRSRFVDELMGGGIDSHPGYYGTLVWILMMLEQWFSVSSSESASVKRDVAVASDSFDSAANPAFNNGAVG
jgi:asparagine synthase (glutamine-hydrolysing)